MAIKHSTKVKRICQYCKQAFLAPQYKIREGKAKYCGRPCYHKAKPIAPEVRFWKHVAKTECDGCWLWTAALASNGYGEFGRWSAHRFSYSLHYGHIAKGMHVLHRCDVRHCVRPDHLFLGTHQDNMNDMVQKRRQACGARNGRYTHPENNLKGERNPKAKLTEHEVRVIRWLAAGQNLTRSAIAQLFRVSLSTIEFIVAKKSWEHVK